MTEREREILAHVVDAVLLLLEAARRGEALELALRRSRALRPGHLEAAEQYLAGFEDDASQLRSFLQEARGDLPE
jgi:hypothetical protein